VRSRKELTGFRQRDRVVVGDQRRPWSAIVAHAASALDQRYSALTSTGLFRFSLSHNSQLLPRRFFLQVAEARGAAAGWSARTPIERYAERLRGKIFLKRAKKWGVKPFLVLM